jgi:tRNA (Thr-GGU) A37 N-methylase
MSGDIRAGEIAVTLPDTFDAGIYFIGRIRTPWARREDCPKNARGSDAVCTVELDERYAAALEGVATCTHLVLLYFMDRARRDLMVQSPRHGARKGTFALRSPVRPNPIAMSVVRLVSVDGARSAWTASTAHRWSTSSRISPRSTRFRTRSSDGRQRIKVERWRKRLRHRTVDDVQRGTRNTPASRCGTCARSSSVASS